MIRLIRRSIVPQPFRAGTDETHRATESLVIGLARELGL